MKKSILYLTIIIFVACLSCSKETNTKSFTITNSSGIDWHSTQVWFRNGNGGDLNGYKDVGMVQNGKSCNVSTNDSHFYIYAKDPNGKMVMSKDIPFSSNNITVTPYDLITENN